GMDAARDESARRGAARARVQQRQSDHRAGHRARRSHHARRFRRGHHRADRHGCRARARARATSVARAGMTQHGDPTLAPRCVAVVGAGAVGGYFGAVLARAGAAVTFLARAAQAEAIERDGLMVSHASGEWRAPVRATTRPADVADADLLLVAVKSQDTEGAITGVKPHLRSDARILSMQNGVDNAARIAAQV